MEFMMVMRGNKTDERFHRTRSKLPGLKWSSTGAREKIEDRVKVYHLSLSPISSSITDTCESTVAILSRDRHLVSLNLFRNFYVACVVPVCFKFQ